MIEKISTMESLEPKIIGVDIDEVLSWTIKELVQLLNRKFNLHLTYEDMAGYDPRNIPEVQQQWIKKDESWFALWRELYLSADTWEVISGAKEKLQEWKNQGHTLIAVTGRNVGYLPKTEIRLKEHFAGFFDKILYSSVNTPEEIKKSDLCKQAGIQVMIEDNLDFVKDLSENGIPCFLLDKPRNQNYTPEQYPKVIKVHSWNEIDLSNI